MLRSQRGCIKPEAKKNQDPTSRRVTENNNTVAPMDQELKSRSGAKCLEPGVEVKQ